MAQEQLRILIVGNGGRNGGTGPKITNVNIKGDNYPALVEFAQKNQVNLVVPGPEAPLVDGIQGYFQAVGIRCFGPSKAAARLEGSKTFSKDFMQRHNIPTAEFGNFSDYEAARRYLDSVSHNVVIKADGLAGGKGVIIPTTKEEAHQALKEMMVDLQFGKAGNEVVIEEYLEGDELSILTFSDGYTIRSLPPAQDHKRIFDGDQGPNTGGMGCYAPTRIAPKEVREEIDRTIIQPSIDSMRKDGFPFVGILFTGLMMTKNGPKVLEYNVRGGDPETQTLLPLLSADTDLAQIMVACAEHWLDGVSINIEPKYSTTVIGVAGGYPGSYAKGKPITLDPTPEGTLIFHAGTTRSGNELLTSGGRVIAATATASTLEEAVKKSYEGISTIHFEGMFYRKDIAHRAFRQTANTSLTYAAAGVSIDAGNELVNRIKTAVKSTKRPGTDAVIGGFGGLFSLAAANSQYHPESPTLIGAIDGVGTKLKIAHSVGIHDTVGVDLVAMNVNDLVVQGAEPLFFLATNSCGHLDVPTATAFVTGVADGCVQAGCALIGGETAEMPGLFVDNTYDAIVERAGLSYSRPCPLLHARPARRRLSRPCPPHPHPYLRQAHPEDPCLSPRRDQGSAHITGGGLVENIPRMLPATLTADIDVRNWKQPSVFNWLQRAGNVSPAEMARAFNCGVGMVIAVDPAAEAAVRQSFESQGEAVYRVGQLRPRAEGEEGCELTGLESWA
ncbi:Bifunctional purine biosynthetic protein ADE1 [Penicillium chermesinum]|uniref:Bifunctional purine biosynthetic protein ADE1 n=1 Tax=Penicillium chermesinum TaxID=63820 RepID=A0A9W9PKA0_9EURO|nr:Bifunctional purine biosynthetic protein ADE1 [Penicillium chermesinum]KAJ5248982.1 Bifunctional purine biosynthetic protein ADE1 [Penicillium chermesinum]